MKQCAWVLYVEVPVMVVRGSCWAEGKPPFEEIQMPGRCVTLQKQIETAIQAVLQDRNAISTPPPACCRYSLLNSVTLVMSQNSFFISHYNIMLLLHLKLWQAVYFENFMLHLFYWFSAACVTWLFWFNHDWRITPVVKASFISSRWTISLRFKAEAREHFGYPADYSILCEVR